MHKEIERKFLVKMPDFDTLKVAATIYAEQYYISDTDHSETRVRKTVIDRIQTGETLYTLDMKSKKADGSIARDELTLGIDEGYYNEAKKFLLPDRAPVTKIRYEVPIYGHFGNLVHNLEFDVFDRAEDLCIMGDDSCIMEIELRTENETLRLPDFVEIIKEVTDDPSFYSSNIAARLKNAEKRREIEPSLVRNIS